MIKSKRLLLAAGMIVILVVTALAGCTQQAPSQTTQITLKTHFHGPESNALAVRYRWWCEQVTKKSGGKVQFQHYYNETLAKSKDQWTALGAGLFDFGNCHPFYNPSDFPLLNITETPWGITWDSTALARAYEELVKLPAVQEEIKKMNVRFIYAINPGGSRWIGTAKKPINTVDDLKGLKLRESGGYATLLSKLGANPAAIPVPDVYDAISKGTLDGFSGPISAFTSNKFAEVCKYYNTVSVGPGEGLWMVNLDSWNKLPKDIQQIMTDVTKDFVAYCGPTGVQFVKDSFEQIKQAKVTIVEFPASEQAKIDKVAESIVGDYAKELNSKGLPGTLVWDTWRNAVLKYTKEVK